MVRPAGGFRSSLKTATSVGGERRQVTALFYDIVGSTQLLQQFDPEDFALLQRRVHSQAAAVIADHGGYLDRLQGDGGSAYFGFPVASEDAAECAIDSALALVDWCRDDSEDPDRQAVLRVRVGIATGMIVISDTEGSALPGSREFIGIAPALAARLQAEAEPNSVVVSDSTYRLTRGAFEFRPLGEHLLKGFTEPARLWQPISRSAERDRFSSRRHVLTPLIGREYELDLCRQRWANARDGHGQVVLVLGEAGIGKSRFVNELCRDVLRSDVGVRVLQCLPRGNTRPLHPFVDALRREIRRDNPGPPALGPEEIRAFMQADGAAVSGKAADAIAFLSGGSTNASPDLPAEDAKREALDAAFEVMIAWSRRRPQLVVIEDVHWADTLTEMMISEMPGKVADQSVLAVVTSRRGLSPDLLNDPAVLAITLSPLDARDTPRLLEAIWSEPPRGIAAFIYERSDGVPLFAEQLTDFLKERFGDGKSNAQDWKRALQDSGVVSLQDLLSARLSGLGEARRVAQVASVLGREIEPDLLSVLIDHGTRPSLDEALTRLVHAGILQRHDAGRPAYRFRHNLIQEAAYDSLLRADRREIHRSVADLVIAGKVPPPPDEILAWHCEQAGRPFDAAFYAVRAAEACALRSAVQEAEQLLAMAANNLSHCEASQEVDELALRLLATRGPIAIAVAGKGSSAARAIYEQGIGICRQREINDRERWFPLYWGWWYTSPDRNTKRSRSEVLINDLGRANDPEVRLQTFHCAWAANFHAGQHHLCMDCINRGLRLYNPDRGRVSRVTYGGHDAKVCGLGERAQLLWLMGDPIGANDSIRQALDWAEAIDHLGSLCHALDNAILLCCYQRDVVRTLELARRLRELGDTQDWPEAIAKSRIFSGWALAVQGSLDEGLREFEEGMRTQQLIGSDEDVPVYRSLWAELLAAAKQPDRALSVLDKAIQEAEETGNLVWVPELYRQRAIVSEALDAQRDAALQDLARAAALAERQGAAALAARARAEMDRLSDRDRR